MERQGEEVQPGQSLTPLLLLQLWSPEEKGGGKKTLQHGHGKRELQL